MINLLKKSEGVELSGFPSSRVIFILLDKDLMLVHEEIEKFYIIINELVNEATGLALGRVFQRFPKLLDQMTEIVNKFVAMVKFL